MKKAFLVIAMAMSLFMLSGYAQAGPISTFDQYNVDPVVFWIIDTGNESSHSVDLTFWNLNPTSYAGQIQWRTSTSDTWTTLSPDGASQYNLTIDLGSSDRSLFYLQLVPEGGGDPLTIADVLHFSDDSIVSGEYDTVKIYWDADSGTNRDLVLTPTCDRVAPVPIPAAMLLFGSGILGLLGLRRRA